MEEGCRSPLVADLRVVFIDISGGVAEYAYMHTAAHMCVYVLVKLLGLEGRAVRVAWLVHGTEGDRYELQPLVRAPSSCPRAHLRPLTFFSLLLITFLLLFRPTCYFAFSLRRALSRFLGGFCHDFASRRIFY